MLAGQAKRLDVGSLPTRDRFMIRLFLDFDGTIAVNDVGDEFFRTFGDFERLHAELLRGEYSVAEYYRRSAASVRHMSDTAVATFLAAQELDSGARDLITWSVRESIPTVVVSDGFDRYIEPLLEREGIRTHVGLACNTLKETERGLLPVFPGATESCSCFCASCKRNTLLVRSAMDDVLIYVGDGRSDACAVEFCDVVFAKGILAASCTERGIPHHPYRTLTDVMMILQSKLRDGSLRARRQARLARQRAVAAE